MGTLAIIMSLTLSLLPTAGQPMVSQWARSIGHFVKLVDQMRQVFLVIPLPTCLPCKPISHTACSYLLLLALLANGPLLQSC